MSWKSGGVLFAQVAVLIDKWVPEEERVGPYKTMIQVFSDGDCDTLEYALTWVDDALPLRKAFVETGYWRTAPQYGEYICTEHYLQIFEDSPCPEC